VIRNYSGGKKSESTKRAYRQEGGDVSEIDQFDLLPWGCYRLVPDGALLHIDTLIPVPSASGKNAGDGADCAEMP